MASRLVSYSASVMADAVEARIARTAGSNPSFISMSSLKATRYSPGGTGKNEAYYRFVTPKWYDEGPFLTFPAIVSPTSLK